MCNWSTVSPLIISIARTMKLSDDLGLNFHYDTLFLAPCVCGMADGALGSAQIHI
ncbi:MAG: hypothetical protein ACLQT6_00120 [Desulfomonilaceae bacterium]